MGAEGAAFVDVYLGGVLAKYGDAVREEGNTWWELEYGGGGHCRRNSSNKVGGGVGQVDALLCGLIFFACTDQLG